MTTPRPERRPVDIDLLADYLAGLLDDAATRDVGDLVATDPDWSATAAILGGAERSVTEALASSPYGREPMPDDVAARIDTALRVESAPAPGKVVRITAARRSRARRLAGSGWLRAAAAIIVAAGSIGLLIRVIPTTSSKTASSSAGTMAHAPAMPLPTLAHVTITASGTDYATKYQVLTSPGPLVPGPTRRPYAGPNLAGPSSSEAVTVPPELARLASGDQLAICLTAISTAFGGTVTRVDFAQYDAAPAVVVTLTPSGTIVAVGPDCGVAGPDTIATVGHS